MHVECNNDNSSGLYPSCVQVASYLQVSLGEQYQGNWKRAQTATQQFLAGLIPSGIVLLHIANSYRLLLCLSKIQFMEAGPL